MTGAYHDWRWWKSNNSRFVYAMINAHPELDANFQVRCRIAANAPTFGREPDLVTNGTYPAKKPKRRRWASKRVLELPLKQEGNAKCP